MFYVLNDLTFTNHLMAPSKTQSAWVGKWRNSRFASLPLYSAVALRGAAYFSVAINTVGSEEPSA